jgi:two-component system response regulator YesN
VYTILIVDDEQTTRDGLARHFDWNRLGLSVIGEADDGTAALKLIEELKPDILLTDVKMAFMDGLELARRAAEITPSMKTIFISGYDEVDFIRSALRLGARDYILKPIEFAELESCLLKVTEQLDKEREVKSDMMDMLRKSTMGLPYLRSEMLAQLLRGELLSETSIQERLDFLGLRLNAEKYAAFFISLDEAESPMESNWQLFSFCIRNICEETLEKSFKGYVIECPNRPRSFAGVVQFSGSINEVFESVSEIRQNLDLFLQSKATIGLGPEVFRLKDLGVSYRAALDAVLHRIYMDQSGVLSLDRLESQSLPPGNRESLPKMMDLLTAEDEEDLSGWLSAFFKTLADSRSTDAAFYRGKCGMLIFEAFLCLKEQVTGDETGELSQHRVLERLYHSQTLGQMKEIVVGYCQEIRSIIGLKNDSQTKRAIEVVKKVIRERYGENLTIESLAAEVYLSPTYLCMLFHQAVGCTINTWLTTVRMEKAKEMLADLGNKLYDISFAVGYANPSYFSRQFRKFTGLSPSAYRNQLG